MCTSVENVGSAMASMPYYMSQGINELTANGIEKAIHGLMQMLSLTITGIEEIVVFIINFLTQTYICLLTFAIGGSLHAAISVAEDVGSFLNSTAKDVGKDLGNAADEFQKLMNGFIAGVDDVGSFFAGHKLNPPTIDLTKEINKLDNLQLPSDYDLDLQKLNASIPTFKQVHALTNSVIKFPFEEVKKLLDESLPKYTMDRSLFPVPAKQQLTFCSDNNGISDFFDDLVKIEQLAKKIFLIVIVILAVLAMIPMAYRELKRWKFMKERALLVKSNDRDPMDSVYLVSRPYTSTAGLKIAEKLKSKRRQTLARWSVAYATTVPALFVLSLALAGLLACGCQYILLKAIEKEVPKLENQVIGFSDKVINQLNNASEQWALGTNNIINDTSTKINQDVFGWVNTTTSAVNETLNTFVDGIMEVLNETFKGTVLYSPILDVLNCLLFYKIDGIEKGLTWVSDNAYIDFPMLPKDTFSLGTINKVTGSESDILATGANGGAADAITAAMFDVTNFIEKGIRQEAIISTCVLLIWVIIALVGIVRALFLMFKGGNDGVYQHPYPSIQTNGAAVGLPAAREKRGSEDSHVPTYEQATQNGNGDPGYNDANRYRGQAYTLTPLPMPSFNFNPATSPVLNTGFRPSNEKLGTVNGRNVDAALRRQTHVRSSSYGDYVVASPTSANPPQNPFADSSYLYPSKSPFTDPAR